MKPDLKLLFFIVFTTIYTVQINAQSFELKIYTKNSTNNYLTDSITYGTKHHNKTSIYNEIEAVSNLLSVKGYINNSYTLKENDTIVNCYFVLNKRINTLRIYYNTTNIDTKLLKEIATNYNSLYFETTTATVQNKLNLITTHYEKQGYSFIKASLKNLNLKNNIIEADLDLKTSIKRTINAVIIKGYNNFPKKYLKHYLEIKNNTIFNKNKLQKTEELLNTIPFITQLKKPEVLFTKDSTNLYLYIKKKNTNQFDGIIGFSNSTNNKFTINGYLNLNLTNIFNKGEYININWKNNRDDKTSLFLNLNIPYILRSKFSLDGSFNIYRQDSTYNTTNTKIALAYNLNKDQSLSGIVNFEKSNVLDATDLNGIEPFDKRLFGLSYIYQPQSNFLKNNLSIELNYLIGKRNTNSAKSNQSKGLASLSYQWNLNTKNKIFIKNTTELLNTSNNLLENELFQIGGINSIRGFEDQSILTPKYNLTNLEYKLYTNTTNYLYSISDLGFIKNEPDNTTNTLIGVGIGYNFKSKNNIVNLSYVFGKTNNQPFKINNAKIHIKFSYNF
ncbi:hypothetical protein MHL31_06945 [Lutibacter sp. A80]|uniref:POTRA domain-containing protein n=1 Tax=Lutibacter sp. A80 TaxID=2918453 RepID=UPI001F05CBDC|nr:POTRA domain-containing protein [Lutibacter sp. A80]UMB61923.1 hypothetical protein MHL31_06945 [Lutibacter sp. A80]